MGVHLESAAPIAAPQTTTVRWGRGNSALSPASLPQGIFQLYMGDPTFCSELTLLSPTPDFPQPQPGLGRPRIAWEELLCPQPQHAAHSISHLSAQGVDAQATRAMGTAQPGDHLGSGHARLTGQGQVPQGTTVPGRRGQVRPHHIGLGGESVGLQALQRHPLDREASVPAPTDAVIFFIQDVAGQPEVGHLDCE